MSDNKNRRVLVVDDNQAVHDDFRKILAPRQTTKPGLEESERRLFGITAATSGMPPFEVDSAYQGAEAAILVQKAVEEARPYAMAFVDVRMPPGWDGVETTQKIWEIDPDLQVVLCTAYSDYSRSELFERIGHHDGLLVLKKPFDPVEASQLAYSLTEKWWLHQESCRKAEEWEQRVKERTHQLRQTNCALAAEVAERKRTELQLRKLSRAVEQSPVVVIITDRHGTIEYVNPKFCSLTGYGFEDVRGKNSRCLKSGATPAETFAPLWATISAGHEWRGEFHNRKKNGETYWVAASIAPIRDDAGDISHFIAIEEDITEQKRSAEALQRAEMELAKSERQQKTILDNILDPAWMRDPEGRFLSVNQAWCDFCGMSETQLVGKTIGELPSIYSAELARKLREEDEMVMASGKPSQRELQLTSANLGAVWLESIKAPLFDEKGVPYAVVGIGRNITKRKEAEAALQQSHRFLQSTLDALSAQIAILDEHGSILAVNAAWSRFARENGFLGSGYGLGANYLSFCEAAAGDCAGEAPMVAKGIRDVMAGKCGEFLLEYPCHSPREQRWFVVRVTRFGGEGAVRVVVAHENITARKQAEEELRWKTAFLEAQVNSSIDGILVVDEQGYKKLQNQRMTDLFKIPPHIAGSTEDGPQLQWVAQAAKDPMRFIERVKQLNSQRKEISRDELEMKDGMILDRYSSPMTGSDGHYYGRMWTFRDITERKRMEMQTEQLRAEQELILNTIGEGLHWVDTEGRIKFENPAAAKMLGYEVSELIGRPAHATMHHTRADGSPYPPGHCPIYETLSDKTIRRVTDEVFWRKDGTSFSVEYTCTPVYNRDGRSGGTMVVFTDVSERKRTQAELASLERRALEHKLAEEHSRLALEQERELGRIKGQFVSMVSHEFRTPLCVINSAASLLRFYSAQMTAEERAEQGAEIQRAVERMTRMMEDFLTHEKLQSGKMRCQPARVNLDAFCRELVSEMAKRTGANGVIQFSLDPCAGDARLDESILRQILCNLLSNAVKYSDKNQTVFFEVKHVGCPLQTNGDPKLPSGDYIQFRVCDTGIGIPAADLGKIYQTFHRGANVGNRPGNGMGLAIVKKFVDLHQGLIHLESTEGRGTSVTVLLPSAAGEEATETCCAQLKNGKIGVTMT